MKRSLRASLLSAAILPVLGPLAMSQQQLNEIQLNNGGDGLFYYDEPSPGLPPGSSDVTNNFVWKIFPKEVLRRADATGTHMMEWNGGIFAFFDGDWSNDSQVCDIELTTTTLDPSGTLLPDFADPNAALLSFGASWTTFTGGGAPDPCTIAGNPLGCVGGCPPGGGLVGYIVEYGLAGNPGPNGGFEFLADGNVDYATTTFIPPGMDVTINPGPCGIGNYTFSDLHSSAVFAGGVAETQAQTAGGNSFYGGFSVIAGAFADNVDEGQDQPLSVQQMVVEGETSLDPVVNPATGATGLGLSSLRTPLNGGTTGWGPKINSDIHLGEFGFVFGSVFPQLPYPGLQFFGIDFLINLADPVVNTTSSFWAGTLSAQTTAAGTASNELTCVKLTIPAVAAGITFNYQGYTLNLGNGVFDASGSAAAFFLTGP